MRGLTVKFGAGFCLALILTSTQVLAQNATVTALRLANEITGGYMPTTDPLFTQMVSQVQAGNIQGAAATAANSKYFANYLARRLAFQMQTPSLDASAITDSDATAYLIAHFVGGNGFSPSISTIWSEDATYLVDVNGTNTHAASLGAQEAAVDWSSQLVQVQGQNAQVVTFNGNTPSFALGPIPQKDVGGYVTLSDRNGDNSFAMYGASAGTNLRFIEGIWEISTGLQLADFENTSASPQSTPRFVPEYDPNFFNGQGQPACISCHGGGLSSANHGYAAVADVFDFDPKNGFSYYSMQTTGTRKSLGSDPNKRSANLNCNLAATPTPVCNPDSLGVDINNGWDVSATWSSSGMLSRMEWTGPTTGQGLNALGQAIGQAGIVYQNMVKRVIGEICPLGAFTTDQVAQIANLANPYAQPKGTDDIRTIVAAVASNQSCL